jgi:lipopolysaccharide export system protein LptA
MSRASCVWVALFVLAIGTGSEQSRALSSDKDQPIELEADGVELDEGRGVSVYRGNVVLNQGTMRLNADRLTVTHTGTRPTKIVAEGRPVRFRQLPDDSKEFVYGRAQRAEYSVDSEELVLIGDARLEQGKDSFQSDRIVYNRIKSRIKAGAAAEGKERVKITITPPSQRKE